MADLLSAIAHQTISATGSSNTSRGNGDPSTAPGPVHDPGAAADLVLFAQLAQQYADQHGSHAAASRASNGSSGDTSSAGNALGAWLHAPGFPYLTFKDAPGVESGSAETKVMVAAARQHPYCSWQQLPAHLKNGPGAGMLNTTAAEGLAFSCPTEEELQWWLPLGASGSLSLLAPGNASDSSSSSSSGGGTQTEAEVSLWVADPTGAGLFRTAYPEQYLHRLLAAIKGLKPCCRCTSDGNSSGDSSSSGDCSSGGDSSSSGDGSIGIEICSALYSHDMSQAANYTVGSTSCGGSLGADSCELSAGPLLAAAPVVADGVALATVGIYPASWAVDTAQAAAQADIAATGEHL